MQSRIEASATLLRCAMPCAGCLQHGHTVCLGSNRTPDAAVPAAPLCLLCSTGRRGGRGRAAAVDYSELSGMGEFRLPFSSPVVLDKKDSLMGLSSPRWNLHTLAGGVHTVHCLVTEASPQPPSRC